MPNLKSMKFLRGCFVAYCNFAKSGYSGDMDSLFGFFWGAETVRKAASDFST